MTAPGDGAAGVGHDAVPTGFRPVSGLCGPFIAEAAPLFGRLDGQTLELGFRVQRRHTNPLDCAHGGMLASLADMLIAASAMYREEGRGRVLPTVSLQLDFMAPAPLGAWVQGRAEVLRATGALVFVQAIVRADGEAVLRASGVLRRGEARHSESRPWDPLQLRG